MLNDPSIVNDVPNQAVEVTQALTLVDDYTNKATGTLTKIATIVGGDSAAKFGINNENVKRVLMAVGAFASLKYLTTNDKVLKYKWYILGSMAAVIAFRYYSVSKITSTQIASTPSNPLAISNSTTI
jgi:hypothetical protein